MPVITTILERGNIMMRFKIIAFFIGMLMMVCALRSSNGWAIGPYTVSGDTVIDEGTGLVWQNDADVTSKRLTWKDALAYCENLTLGGYDDWRLPNKIELLSIVDYTRYGPAIDTSVFSCESGWSSYYWSSTSYANSPDGAWAVGFYDGYAGWDFKDISFYVRCVRGGLSGHSDSLIIKEPITITPSPSSLSGDAPYLAAFSIQVSGGTPPYSFNWSFGDGSSGSSDQSPAHQYSTPGAYTATVTVTDSQGDTSTATIAVTVNEPPNTPPSAVITLNTPNTGEAPFEVKVSGGHSSDPDGTIVKWEWSFGDGSPDASTMDVAHTYASEGQYVLTLTVTDNRGATATATQAIVVTYTNKPPTASITVSATEGTAPLNVAFAGSGSDPEGGTLSFHWVFGDGEEGDGRAINHTFSTQGDYTVRLTVTDSAGKQGTSDVVIHVKEAPKAPPPSPEPVEDTAPKDAGSGQGQGEASGIGRAIIIAGSGAHEQNTLFPITKELTKKIYKLLKARGFTDDDIIYFNPVTWIDITGDGADDHVVDYSDVTAERLEEAFNIISGSIKQGEQFVFYYHGHGKKDALKLNRYDWYNASGLSGLFNKLPEGVVKVIILDSCYSGSFLDDLKGKNRVILTSSDDSSRAWNAKGMSFTDKVWEILRRGLDLREAFLAAEEMMRSEKIFKGQRPWLDDTGDGVFSSVDGVFVAKDTVIGRDAYSAAEPPQISGIHPALRVEAEDACSKVIWAKAVSGEGAGVKTVRAVIVPPDFSNQYDPESEAVGLGTTEVELLYNGAQDRWELKFDGFRKEGLWNIYYTAIDDTGDESDMMKGEVNVIKGCGEAAVNALFNQSVYKIGDRLKFDVEVNANGRFDLYVGIIFPDKYFITIGENYAPSLPNTLVPFKRAQEFNGMWSTPVFDMTLPRGLQKGEYQGCVLLVREDMDPWDASNWVDFKCSSFSLSD